VSIDEMLGKLRGAIAARQDPALTIIGRTSALRGGNIAEAEQRVKAYQETGIDAIFLAGASRREEVEAMHRAVKLPLLLGDRPQHCPTAISWPPMACVSRCRGTNPSTPR